MATQQASFYAGVLIASLVIGIIIIFFTTSVIWQQKRVLKLQKENMLIEISAMEKERARIAADLHDDLGPILSVVKFQIDNVETLSEEDQSGLCKASSYIDDMVIRLREISNDLMPNSLIRKGIISAIEEFRKRVENSNSIKIAFAHNELPTLSEQQNIHVYRMIQELVHNSLKHANATSIHIDLKGAGQLLTLLYKDNGAGFNYEKIRNESTGIGLRSLKNRVELIGGSLIVESVLMKGSAFLFTIPLKL